MVKLDGTFGIPVSSFYKETDAIAQLIQNLPAGVDPGMQETWVQFLSLEDPLEKEMATSPVFLPGNSHGQRSLVGYSPRGGKSWTWLRTSLVAHKVKHLAYNVGDLGSIPGSGRSSGEGNGNPLQHSCLENPMDGGAWWATVHGVARVGHDWETSLSLSNETTINAQRSQVSKSFNGRKVQSGMELRGGVDGRWKTPDPSSCNASFLSLVFRLYDYKPSLPGNAIFTASLHILPLYLPHTLPKVILQVTVPRMSPSSTSSLSLCSLPLGLALAHQKSDLNKTSVPWAEWLGAWLELPCLLITPGQLGHWV